MIYNKICPILVCAMVVFCLMAKNLLAEEVTIIADDCPPFSYMESGKLAGFSIELFDLLLEDTDLLKDYKYEFHPWARALRALHNGRKTIVLSMIRNSVREKKSKWVGPICPRNTWIYKLASRDDIVIEKAADTKKYHIGSMRGSATTDRWESIGNKVDENIELVATEKQNVLKLLKGRVDIIGLNKCEVKSILKGIPKSQLKSKRIKPIYFLDGRDSYYIGLSKDFSDSFILRLQKSLDRVKEGEEFRRLRSKYLE